MQIPPYLNYSDFKIAEFNQSRQVHLYNSKSNLQLCGKGLCPRKLLPLTLYCVSACHMVKGVIEWGTFVSEISIEIMYVIT